MIQSPAATSYYTDAAKMAADGQSISTLLQRFPEAMVHLHVHTREKPPGPLLFYIALIRLLGPGRVAALAAAGIISALAALGAPATFAMIRALLDGERRDEVAFIAATLFSLSPAIYFHFPQFDAGYAAVVAFGIFCWMNYLRGGRIAWLIGVIALMLLTTFWVFNLLICGALAPMLAWTVRREGNPRAWPRFWFGAGGGILVVIFAYLLLGLLTGFHPIATLRAAMASQAATDVRMGRYFPWTLRSDLLEFCGGVGGGVIVAATFGLFDKAPGVMWAVTAQCMLVAFSGLLKCETSRVWIFLIPLLLAPAAWEISRWKPAWKWMLQLAMWLAIAALAQNVRRLGRG